MLPQRLSISQKLILMIITSSMITLLLAISTILYFNIQTIKDRAIVNITVLGDVIAERSTAALAFMDHEQAEINLKALKNMKYIELGCLYDFELNVIASYIKSPDRRTHSLECPKQLTSDVSQGSYLNDHLLWGREIYLDDSVIGYIYIVTDNSFVFEEFYKGILQYILVILMTIVFSFFIAKHIQKFLSQPIVELQYTAKKIAFDKDFSIRAEKTSDDELGDLTDAFNSMLQHTEEYEKTLIIQKKQLETHQEHLEATVIQRTQKLQELNNELTETLARVESMQGQLIESEKMASLGGLVAGVAHEVNTPIGVCLTAASFLHKRLDYLEEKYQQSNMTKEDFEEFLETVNDGSKMIISNIQRATEIISNFKKVAVDQSVEESRCFNVKEYFFEIIKSLHPKLKRHNHSIEIIADDDLIINSYPGSFYQIFSNLILNSYIHGFEVLKEGKILIQVTVQEKSMLIEYRDNGQGMSTDIADKVFEPFVTTKRHQGGSGLGAHIIYNIVTQQLQGKITCESSPGNGVIFKIEIPINVCEGGDLLNPYKT